MGNARTSNSDEVLMRCVKSMRDIADALERVVNGEITMVQASKVSGASNNEFRRSLRWFKTRASDEEVPKNLYLEITPQEKLYELISGYSSRTEAFYKSIPEDIIKRVDEYCDGKCCTLSEKERMAIKSRFSDGETLDEIGKRLGVSRQRVDDIIMKTVIKMRFKAGVDYRFLSGEIDDVAPPKSPVIVSTSVFGELSKRAKVSLSILGATTDEDISNVDCMDIVSLPNVGLTTAEEIVCKLVEKGYGNCKFTSSYALAKNKSTYFETIPVGELIDNLRKLDPDTRIKRNFYVSA